MLKAYITNLGKRKRGSTPLNLFQYGGFNKSVLAHAGLADSVINDRAQVFWQYHIKAVVILFLKLLCIFRLVEILCCFRHLFHSFYMDYNRLNNILQHFLKTC